MKHRILAAMLIAAFLLLAPVHAMAGNGGDKTGNAPDDSTFNWEDFMPEPTPTPSPSPTPTPTPPPPIAETPPAEEPPAEGSPWIENPVTPPGTGTVIDNSTNADGTEFFTIRTANGNIFYLIVDRRNHQENVYFLNAVTERDLLALAELAGDVDFPMWPTPEPPPVTPLPDPEPEPQPEPTPEPEPERGGLGMGPVLIVVLVAVAGAGWYFKMYRPNQQKQAAAHDDFDYGDEDEPYEAEEEMLEDAAPLWDEEDEE